MKTGQKIKHFRKAKDWTQKDLADALGISYQSVQQWEDPINPKGPKRTRLASIAKALGVTEIDLLPGSEILNSPLKLDSALLEKIILSVETEMPGASAKEKAQAIRVLYQFTLTEKAQ